MSPSLIVQSQSGDRALRQIPVSDQQHPRQARAWPTITGRSANLEGTNGPGHITCEGLLNPPIENGWELSLHFGATNVPLQDDLCEALNAQSQRVWKQLKPQGAINLTADMHYLTATKMPEIQFAAEPVDETTSIEPAVSLSARAAARGSSIYREGHIDLEGIAGRSRPDPRRSQRLLRLRSRRELAAAIRADCRRSSAGRSRFARRPLRPAEKMRRGAESDRRDQYQRRHARVHRHRGAERPDPLGLESAVRYSSRNGRQRASASRTSTATCG